MSDVLLEKKRLYHIDRLKALGLFLVILAHVDLPASLTQIRSFDVPLLVFVSAYLARKSYQSSNMGVYYKKRLLRLAIPAWIFSLFFWVVQSMILTPPTFSDIMKGLTFQRDTNMLGMLWVIWVYIVCALLIPIIDKMKFKAASKYMAIILLVLFQILCSFTTLKNNRFLYCTLFTVVPYGFITWLGYYYDNMSNRVKNFIICTSELVFLVAAVILYVRNDRFVPIADYKYPAQIYYLFYSIPIVFLLFRFMPYFDKYKISRMVQFISGSSLWIYLWHILILYAVKMFIEDPTYWWLQYILIVVASVFTAWIQNKVVDMISTKFEWKLLKVFRG